jgi:hypothetical protein
MPYNNNLQATTPEKESGVVTHRAGTLQASYYPLGYPMPYGPAPIKQRELTTVQHLKKEMKIKRDNWRNFFDGHKNKKLLV